MTFNKKTTKKENEDLDDLDKEKKVEVRCQVRDIQERYEKFKKDLEAAAGQINLKNIKQRYDDFKKKLEVWKERVNFRKRFKRNYLKSK